MLSKEEKITILSEIQKVLEKKIFNLKLEIRLFERKKILAGSNNIIENQNSITSFKKEIDSCYERLEIVEDELKELNKK